MPIQIEIKDEYVKSITEFYGTQLKEIREKKIALDKEEKEIENIITQLHNGTSTTTTTIKKESVPVISSANGNGYNSKSTILEKIKYILKESEEGMTSREIIDRMLTLEPALNANKQKTAKNISTILSINKETDLKRDSLLNGKVNVYSIR